MLGTQRFHSSDLVRLAAALDTCVRPLDFPSPEEWRAALLARVMELLEAPIGHFDLRGLGLEQETLSRGYEGGVFESYLTDWLDRDPAYAMLSRLNLTTYTRRLRHRSAGAHWTEKYRRSAVFNEFYLPNGLVDGAGILFNEAGIGVHLHAETRGPGGDLMDERGRQLLLALEPALRATVISLRGATRHRWQARALLDAVDQPLALLGRSGVWIHRTPALGSFLERLPTGIRTELLTVAAGLADRLLASNTGGSVEETEVLRATSLIERHAIRISALLLGPDCPFARGYVLLRMEPVPGVPGFDAELARRAGLTPRELDVARLLVRGLSDKAIADRLHFSWSTARRHTERILKKLRLTSRSGVAYALSQIQNGPD